MMKRRARPFDRMNAFQDLSKIYMDYSIQLNDSRLSSQLKVYAIKHGVPEHHLFTLHKKLLRPYISRKN